MKVVIPGGSGQVGTVLARAFHAGGDEVVILSRKPASAPWRVAVWDAETLGDWALEFESADVIINLAGRSVNCRYTPENRHAIIDSRVHSTRVVGQAIAKASRPPALWLQASSATIYAHRYDAPNDEATGILATAETDPPETWRFSIGVVEQWERAMDEATVPQTRKVKLRTSLVMNPDRGSVFDVLLGLVRHGLGGRAGNGRQYISWIQDQDFTRAIQYLIQHDDMEGPVNLASPNPLPNADFMRALREAWGARFGLPATEWMLEIGAFFLRTETELVLKSRRVTPGRLLENGFTFNFPAWPEAARDLCQRWREMQQ
jgi:hypothetical protein